MHQLGASFTDFGITLLCLIFWWKLWVISSEKKALRHNFLGLFGAAAVASCLGGIVHGFLPDADDKVTRFFWILTLLCVGVSSYNLWMINLQLLFNDRLIRISRNIVRVLFLAYVFVLLFVTQEYYIAIISYIPPALILFLVLLLRTIRERDRYNSLGLVGLILTFVAAYIQQKQIALPSAYLDHNALYHVVQAFGLWGLYFFGSRAVKWNS
jgi:hypothetical protein